MRIPIWPGVRLALEERQKAEPEDPATNQVVEALTRELHRRSTRYLAIRSALQDQVPNDAWVQVSGEVIGLRGALGIALGGQVQGGTADALAHAHYEAWAAVNATEWSRCRCSRCTGVLTNGGGR